MKMFHYSFDPNLKLKEVIQSYTRNFSKPDGLYFAPRDKWKDWCEDNNFSIGKYKYELKNYKELKILVIDQQILDKMFVSNKNVSLNTLTVGTTVYWDDYINNGYDGIHITEEFLCEYKNKEIEWNNATRYNMYNFVVNFDVETVVVWNTEKIKIEKID